MRRREVLALTGAALAWPLGARAQQRAIREILWFAWQATGDFPHVLPAFERGLQEGGYTSIDVRIEFLRANYQLERLRPIADEIMRRKPALVVATGSAALQRLAARTISTIPMLIVTGFDPVKAGLVASLNRPGGNVAGIAFLTTELMQKRVGLIRDMLPKARVLGILHNPANPNFAPEMDDVRKSAAKVGFELVLAVAQREEDFDPAFAALAKQRAECVLTLNEGVYTSRRSALASAALRHSLPIMTPLRETTEAGGLISYGVNLVHLYRRAGLLAARILNGESPAGLPFEQASGFELAINLKTARALNIEVPSGVLAIADEVFE